MEQGQEGIKKDGRKERLEKRMRRMSNVRREGRVIWMEGKGKKKAR